MDIVETSQVDSFYIIESQQYDPSEEDFFPVDTSDEGDDASNDDIRKLLQHTNEQSSNEEMTDGMNVKESALDINGIHDCEEEATRRISTSHSSPGVTLATICQHLDTIHARLDELETKARLCVTGSLGSERYKKRRLGEKINNAQKKRRSEVNLVVSQVTWTASEGALEFAWEAGRRQNQGDWVRKSGKEELKVAEGEYLRDDLIIEVLPSSGGLPVKLSWNTKSAIFEGCYEIGTAKYEVDNKVMIDMLCRSGSGQRGIGYVTS